MHILLTDLLACPRCGPEFGLILLAEHIQDRRVLDGEVGCANCREHFRVDDGLADLRWPRSAAPDPAPASAPVQTGRDAEAAVRIAAPLGIMRGPGRVLLSGRSAATAQALAELVDDVEWVAVGDDARQVQERTGVSRVLATPSRLPFFSGMFRGAVWTGGDDASIRETMRILMPGGRLLVPDPDRPRREAVLATGAEVVLDDPSALVVANGSPGSAVASL